MMPTELLITAAYLSIGAGIAISILIAQIMGDDSGPEHPAVYPLIVVLWLPCLIAAAWFGVWDWLYRKWHE